MDVKDVVFKNNNSKTYRKGIELKNINELAWYVLILRQNLGKIRVKYLNNNFVMETKVFNDYDELEKCDVRYEHYHKNTKLNLRTMTDNIAINRTYLYLLAYHTEPGQNIYEMAKIYNFFGG